MAGNEVEGQRGSCTSGCGGGIVRMAEGRLDCGGRVPSLRNTCMRLGINGGTCLVAPPHFPSWPPWCATVS